MIEREPERVEEVPVHLVQVAEEVIETLAQRVAGAAGEPEAPLAVTSRRVAGRLEDLCQGHVLVLDVRIAEIAPNGGVATVKTG